MAIKRGGNPNFTENCSDAHQETSPTCDVLWHLASGVGTAVKASRPCRQIIKLLFIRIHFMIPLFTINECVYQASGYAVKQDRLGIFCTETSGAKP
jgi:hypothetical protein